MKGFRPCTRLINGFFLTHCPDAYIVSSYGYEKSVKFVYLAAVERLKVANIICSNNFDSLLAIGVICENPIEATTYFERKTREFNQCKLDINENSFNHQNLTQLTIEDFLQVEEYTCK